MSFNEDNAWQRDQRDRILAPGFYGKYAEQGRYVFIDKGRLATILQKRFAVDTIFQGRDGAAVCIEEKIVRFKRERGAYSAFALETKSCTVPGKESDGWMVYGMADFLLYAFQQEDLSLKVFLIDFMKLQKWFLPIRKKFAPFGPLRTSNGTYGRVVPIADVEANVPVWRTIVSEPGK